MDFETRFHRWLDRAYWWLQHQVMSRHLPKCAIHGVYSHRRGTGWICPWCHP